jgi:peptidoglycan biosynthesis protein MviN/MurJ (putative lipid II flippase)
MSLIGKFASVGGATMASRVLGFVREAMIAAFLGAGPVADAFYAAFRFPNLFRRLFAEGAFNAAFVPLFARRSRAADRQRPGSSPSRFLRFFFFRCSCCPRWRWSSCRSWSAP